MDHRLLVIWVWISTVERVKTGLMVWKNVQYNRWKADYYRKFRNVICNWYYVLLGEPQRKQVTHRAKNRQNLFTTRVAKIPKNSKDFSKMLSTAFTLCLMGARVGNVCSVVLDFRSDFSKLLRRILCQIHLVRPSNDGCGKFVNVCLSPSCKKGGTWLGATCKGIPLFCSQEPKINANKYFTVFIKNVS